jgi:hypothetical protein
MFDKIVNGLLTSNDIMYIILGFFVLGTIIFLWAQNRNNKNDIEVIDLIAVNGKLNERKISRFGAWIVSTWGFVYLIISDNLSEWYFIGYMGAWVANALIGKALSKDKDDEDADYRAYHDEQRDSPRKHVKYEPTQED